MKVRLQISDSGQRLDFLLLAELRKLAPSLSRNSLKQYFTDECVHLAGDERSLAPASELPPGSHEIIIEGFDPDSGAGAEARPSGNGSFLPVIYEDEDLLVLNKRSGIPSVPQSIDETETAVGAALARLPELARVGRGGFEPAILHRLDTGTSGLLVFAKHEEEFARLRELWKNREVRKIYRAITRPRREEGEAPLTFDAGALPLTLDFPLAHDAKSSKRMVALPTDSSSLTRRLAALGLRAGPARPPAYRGKALPARTLILEATPASSGRFDLTVEIETGVMHQIRCHLATVGLPIQGDPVYRGTPSSRLWLHAWKLELPVASGGVLALEAAMPTSWPK